MSKRSHSRANTPIHRESLFWILSPIFRLLRSVSCLPPYPPIPPSSPPAAPLHLSSALYKSPLFCKTNPISKWAE